MTSEHVTDFAQELVKMAMATTRVPELERERDEWQRLWSQVVAKNTELKLSLESRTIYAAGLEQKVHDLEVANTAMELRFLECDDAKSTLVRILDNMGKDILGALQAVMPISAPVSVQARAAYWIGS